MRLNLQKAFAAALCASLLALAGCESWPYYNYSAKEIRTNPVAMSDSPTYLVLKAEPQFSTFVSLIDAAGMENTLRSRGTAYTIFAPTNAALAKIPAATLDMLKKKPNREKLRNLLFAHMVLYTLTPTELAAAPTVSMADQAHFVITADHGKINSIGSATVVSPPMIASNGTIYGINQVLMPPSAGF